MTKKKWGRWHAMQQASRRVMVLNPKEGFTHYAQPWEMEKKARERWPAEDVGFFWDRKKDEDGFTKEYEK